MPLPLHAVDTEDSDYSADLGNHFFYLLSEGAVVPVGFGAGTPFGLARDPKTPNNGDDPGGVEWYGNGSQQSSSGKHCD